MDRSNETLLECVPNISEGREPAKIAEIVDAVRASGVRVLHVDIGYDANRTVLTFAGAPREVFAAVRSMYKAVAALLDMRTQEGAHPRIGAVDVCPFVALKGLRREALLPAIETLAEDLSKQYRLPIFLYEDSARNPVRRALANIRRGGYEALATRLCEPTWYPDYGRSSYDPELPLGASVLGLRELLIAFNVSLKDVPLPVAKEIAVEVRRASPSIRAIAWQMPEYGCTQISMNITRFWDFGLLEAYSACEAAAKHRGFEVSGSELIGLLPRQALLQVGSQGLDKRASEAELVEYAVDRLGLATLKPFVIGERVLEETLGLDHSLQFPMHY